MDFGVYQTPILMSLLGEKLCGISNLVNNTLLDFCLGVYCIDCLKNSRKFVYTIFTVQ